MGKTRVQTRVEPDTKSQIDEYAEARDIGDAEALRRLIRSGLAAEGHPVTAADGGTKSLLERLAAPSTVGLSAIFLLFSAALMGLAGVLASNGTLAAALVTLGISTVLMLLALGTVWAAVLAQLALAQPLRGLVFNVEESETA